MTTEYIHRVTIAVPETLLDKANHLACIVGESAADINTFTHCNWQDSLGTRYAVASTVVKPVFLESVSGLPETPEHAIGVADPYLAQQALDTLNLPGGIQMAVDVDPMEALTELGLSPVEHGEDGLQGMGARAESDVGALKTSAALVPVAERRRAARVLLSNDHTITLQSLKPDAVRP